MCCVRVVCVCACCAGKRKIQETYTSTLTRKHERVSHGSSNRELLGIKIPTYVKTDRGKELLTDDRTSFDEEFNFIHITTLPPLFAPEPCINLSNTIFTHPPQNTHTDREQHVQTKRQVYVRMCERERDRIRVRACVRVCMLRVWFDGER